MPWLLFGALTLLKLIFIARGSVAPAGSDELLYFQLAREIASGHLYDSVQYPPLLPALLAPTLSFSAPYPYAIALTSILSSMLVFPVWMTARELVGERHASVVAFLSCLLPFHYTLPRVVMSENLYYPLLVFAGYLVVTTRWKRLVLRDVLTAAVIAASFLTRFMTLIFIPALAVAWLLRERERSGRWLPDSDALLRGGLLVATAVALVAPWVIAEMGFGATLVETLGMDAGLSPGRVPPEAKTLPRLLRFSASYLASWTLWIAPALGLLGLAGLRLVRDRRWDTLDRLTALTGLMAAPLLVIASRHAWKASYNWPVPLRILDRYCIYLVAFGLIIGYAVAVLAPRERRLGLTAHWTLTVLTPIAALVLSYWTRFGSGFIPVPSNASPGFGGSDTYHVFMMGIWFWPVAIAGVALIGWLLWRRDRGTVIPYVAAVALFFIIGMPPYLSRFAGVPAAQAHATVLAPLIAETYPDADRLSVALSRTAADTTGVAGRSLTRGLRTRLEWLTGKTVRTYIAGRDATPTAAFTVLLATEDQVRRSDQNERYRVGDEEFVAIPPQK